MKNGKLQIGVIGCGSVSYQKHFPALKALNDKCEIAAFCATSEYSARKAAEEFGTVESRIYLDYNELLKDSDIDVVHICTPNNTHAPISIATFESGKHVLCEKPMATTVEEARSVMEAWKKSGRKFTVGYQNRFRPDVRLLRRLCQEGNLGDIYFAKAHATRRRAVPTWGVFMDKEKQGGGALIDIGTHALDITLWCMDNYKPVSVVGAVYNKLGKLPEATIGNMYGPWNAENFDVEDSAFGLIKMENGATIILEASWALNIAEGREAMSTLCGTKAGAEIVDAQNQDGYDLLINKTAGDALAIERISDADARRILNDSEGSWVGLSEASQWLDCIINDTDPVVKPEEAFVVSQILDAIYQSAREGREIILKQ